MTHKQRFTVNIGGDQQITILATGHVQHRPGQTYLVGVSKSGIKRLDAIRATGDRLWLTHGGTVLGWQAHPEYN